MNEITNTINPMKVAVRNHLEAMHTSDQNDLAIILEII